MSPEEIAVKWKKNATYDHNMRAHQTGLCKTCSENKPWRCFVTCLSLRGDPSVKCLGENCCGYFWGPSHPNAGERPYWAPTPSKAD